MTDALITSAIAHWAQRCVANGVALADFQDITASMSSWDDWCRGWSARAAVHEAMGRAALARGKHLSAGEHLQRAGIWPGSRIASYRGRTLSASRGKPEVRWNS